MLSVLITDGEQRSALAITRSLGRAGYRVYVCSSRSRSLSGASRFASEDITVPDSLASPQEFATSVRDAIRERSIEVLIPVTEAALLAILPVRASLSDVLLPFPDLEPFRQVCDKGTVAESATSVGIAIPRQTVLDTHNARETLDPNSLRFPLVLKPTRSVAEQDGHRSKLGVRHVANWVELSTHLDSMPSAAYPILMQERILGCGVGIFLLIWNGEVVASFAHRRLREKPPSGGVSVYRKSIPTDPNLVERSAALLGRFGWEGVAMVEYKVDATSGTPYLMEINGRFWGSLQLAIDAGVDFPALLLESARGQVPRPIRSYRSGIRSRWWWGDVDHLLARLRYSAESLALPKDAPTRLKTLMEFSKLWRPGDRYEVLRLADPKPFVRETIDWLHRR